MLKTLFMIVFLAINANANEMDDLVNKLENNQYNEVSTLEQLEESDDNYNHFKKKARIQVLNKITAKSTYIDIITSQSYEVGTLKIKIDSCWKSSPYEPTENKILLDVSEKKPDQQNYLTIFKGWMFSSSPSISSLEHSVYDVIAISCDD